jgi:hypothetical protein
VGQRGGKQETRLKEKGAEKQCTNTQQLPGLDKEAS